MYHLQRFLSKNEYAHKDQNTFRRQKMSTEKKINQ